MFAATRARLERAHPCGSGLQPRHTLPPRSLRWLLCLGLWLASVMPLAAQSPAQMVIATREVPPFAMRDAQGQWHGLSIELWRALASELGLAYRFREMELKAMLEAVERREVDAAVAGLTITSEREQRLDFTHPFLTSGLGIAVHREGERSWLAIAQRLLSSGFLVIITALSGLLFVVGFLLWLVERRDNPQFGGPPLAGIGAGLWWSAVTMTTVGYGDKAPLTPLGRALAIVWMFAALISISSFTAAITTTLTVGELEGKVRAQQDLPHARIATVSDTTSVRYLLAAHLHFYASASLEEALRALSERQFDAVVYDKPMLSYYIHQHPDQPLHVLADRFERQDYGIALAADSPLREAINQVLLSYLHSPEWEATRRRYLGAFE